MQKALEPNDPKVPAWLLWLACILAYGVGVAARLGVHERIDPYLTIAPDGHRVLTTADGYYYAIGIDNALTGVMGDFNRLPHLDDTALVAIGAAIVKWFGVHTSDLAYFFPVYAGPLFVFMALLWGAALSLPRVGLLTALPIAIGYSYLNRTGPGQFDTDVFGLLLPYAALGTAVYGVERKSLTAITAAGIITAAGEYLHPGAADRLLFVLSAAVSGFILFFRRDRYGYHLILTLSVSLINVFALPMPVRVLMVVLAQIYVVKRKPDDRELRIATAVAAALAVVSIWQKGLVITPLVREADGLTFYSVANDIAELQAIPSNVVAERVAGNKPLLAFATMGLVGLSITRPVALVLWPLFILGTLGAHEKGVRFTIYAVPAAALGMSWLVAMVLDLLGKLFGKRQMAAYIILTPLAMAALAYPAWERASLRQLRGTYDPGELELMGQLRRIAKPTDYALGWWDHGYGLAYYSHVGTLADGGSFGEDLFAVAEAYFSDSQLEAAQLARLTVEKYKKLEGKQAMRSVLQDAKNKGLSPENFLKKLATERMPMPEKTSEIFLFLPSRIAVLARAWAKARHVEGIATRGPKAVGFLDVGNAPQGLTGGIRLTSGRVLDTNRWLLLTENGPQRIRSTILVQPTADGSRDVAGQVRSDQGNYHVIYLPAGGAAFVVDDVMLRSNFTQLGLFEQPDPRAFVPAAFTSSGHIYRVVP